MIIKNIKQLILPVITIIIGTILCCYYMIPNDLTEEKNGSHSSTKDRPTDKTDAQNKKLKDDFQDEIMKRFRY
jgi:hypothetical protein